MPQPSTCFCRCCWSVMRTELVWFACFCYKVDSLCIAFALLFPKQAGSVLVQQSCFLMRNPIDSFGLLVHSDDGLELFPLPVTPLLPSIWIGMRPVHCSEHYMDATCMPVRLIVIMLCSGFTTCREQGLRLIRKGACHAASSILVGGLSAVCRHLHS